MKAFLWTHLALWIAVAYALVMPSLAIDKKEGDDATGILKFRAVVIAICATMGGWAAILLFWH